MCKHAYNAFVVICPLLNKKRFSIMYIHRYMHTHIIQITYLFLGSSFQPCNVYLTYTTNY